MNSSVRAVGTGRAKTDLDHFDAQIDLARGDRREMPVYVFHLEGGLDGGQDHEAITAVDEAQARAFAELILLCSEAPAVEVRRGDRVCFRIDRNSIEA